MGKFLSEKEREELRFAHRVENMRRYADRIKTLLLLDAGWSQAKIAEALLIDEKTVRQYRELYGEGKIDRLCDDNYQGSKSNLSEKQIQELQDYLNKNICGSSVEIAAWIRQQWAVNYSLSGVRNLLKNLGFVYKKTKVIPGKADGQAQQEFINHLEQIRKTLKPCDKLYYIDGVHPQHNSHPGYAWVKKGENREIKSNTGRKRLNLNGAVDAQSHEVFIRQDERITAESTLKLLKQLVEANEKAESIYVVLDNARYNRNQVILDYVRDSPIKLLFLPPYAPNLNLIERLWKFFKKNVLANRYYPEFKDFKTACSHFFDQVNQKKYQQELRSLLSMNFQIISSST